jgi:uncharacterized membrane protein YqjE
MQAQAGGLISTLRSLAATLVGLAHTRLELAGTEIEEQVRRVVLILVWTLSVVIFAAIGLTFVALAVLTVYWDTHRVLVASLAALVFFMIALGCGILARRLRGASTQPFASSLRELETDYETLRPKP